MKIERISENQLKLTLTKADLAERKIKLEDLISPSERTQKLFRDIMEQALDEEDFISENTPLMVEAIPSGGDGIMIIVTKVNNKEKHADEDLRRWKKKPMDTLAQAHCWNCKRKRCWVYNFISMKRPIVPCSKRWKTRSAPKATALPNSGTPCWEHKSRDSANCIPSVSRG